MADYSYKLNFTEEMILDPGFRARVLKEIKEPENKCRKDEAYRAYQCFKDMSSIYVLRLLLCQFDKETVREMLYAITNISFTRKIVDKLARVYSSGVKREFINKKKDTKALEEYLKVIKFNKSMKKTNKYLKLFKNTAVSVLPKKDDDKFYIDVNPMPPFFYDVIEDPNNAEEACVYILSNYQPSYGNMPYVADAGYHDDSSSSLFNQTFGYYRSSSTNDKNKIIADEPGDKDTGEYIWWSKSYHFTTNCKGEITSLDIINPIGELPFVNFAADQDGGFWAKGGTDIIDGGVNLNALLTNINHIGIIQGYGQLFMTGKNLPKQIRVGPTHAIQIEYEEGDPKPDVGFLSANPPIADLMKTVEMYTALLLSTNNLSTSGFAASLSGTSNFASGIALMIDKSESIEDVDDQAAIFLENEVEILEIIKKWDDLYRSTRSLIDELEERSLPSDFKKLMITFNQSQPISSEADHLANLQTRKDIGINSMVDLMMKDNPGMSEEQAKEKLLTIEEEKALRMSVGLVNQGNDKQGGLDGQQSDKSTQEEETNLLSKNTEKVN